MKSSTEKLRYEAMPSLRDQTLWREQGDNNIIKPDETKSACSRTVDPVSWN